MMQIQSDDKEEEQEEEEIKQVTRTIEKKRSTTRKTYRSSVLHGQLQRRRSTAARLRKEHEPTLLARCARGWRNHTHAVDLQKTQCKQKINQNDMKTKKK
jgi:hypothetical protein